MTDKVVIISLRVLRISQSLAFYLECWHGYKATGLTGRESWEALEKELTQNHLQARYTSYQSFQSAMSRYHNRNKGKANT